jgi:hypothetical protein
MVNVLSSCSRKLKRSVDGWLIENQWRRQWVKAGGGGQWKWEKGRKRLLHRMCITLFESFVSSAQIFRRGVNWRPFFCSPSWFFRFSGGFSGNFRQKMTLPTFGSNPEKRKKPTLKWAKICQIFKSKGVTSSWSRRHCRERQHLEVKQTYVLTQFSHHIEYYSFRQNLLFKSRKWEQKFIDMSL